MILRAIFWIGLVALLIPHGGVGVRANGCGYPSCSSGAQLVERVRTAGLLSLAQVRADIETAERARNQPG